MIEQGIYTNLSSADYHADKHSLSRSSIKDFNKNPYYYWAMHLNPDRPEKLATPDMIFGSAFHTFILEPHLFNEQYDIEPEKVYLKYHGREAYDEYKAQCEIIANSGKTVLTRDDYDTLEAMKKSLFRDERVRKLLEGGEIEKSLFWQDEHTGIMLKSRPDILHRNMSIDLKTTNDASARGFQYAMADNWYHVQPAMIRDGVRILEGRDIPNALCINIEKKYPYLVSIFCIDETALEAGQKQYKNVLLRMKECIINNCYPDYEIETIALPSWYQV